MELKEDLIDRILRYVAKDSDGINILAAPTYCDCSPAEVHYHIGLCGDAGLVTTKPVYRKRANVRLLLDDVE